MLTVMPRGATSQILDISVPDPASTNNGGLTGIVFNSAGLTCYYHRNVDAAPVNVPLRSMTAGTFIASGFVEVANNAMPGIYQVCLPDAAWASGTQTAIYLYGVANMPYVKVNVPIVDAGVGQLAAGAISRTTYGTMSELAAIPSFPGNPWDFWAWIFERSIHKTITMGSGSAATDTVYKANDTTPLGSSVCSDDGINFTRGRYM